MNPFIDSNHLFLIHSYLTNKSIKFFMTDASVIQTISLTMVIIAIFVISYLFSIRESTISLLLLFFGIFLSIILASGYVKSSEKKK